MANARLMISLNDEDYEALRRVAEERGLPAARLAARMIEDALAGMQVEGRPASPLLHWLRTRLDSIREEGDWPKDITVRLFDQIQTEVPELYEQAAEATGRTGLNREIGRFIKERLRARVVMRNGRPHLVRLSPGKGALIQAATLLEPADGDTDA